MRTLTHATRYLPCGVFAGRRSASFDEDPVTQAHAAAESALEGVDRSTVRALYFASDAPPPALGVLAEALDLPDETETAQFAGAAAALRAAVRFDGLALVAGDATAVLFGPGDPLAEVVRDAAALPGVAADADDPRFASALRARDVQAALRRLDAGRVDVAEGREAFLPRLVAALERAEPGKKFALVEGGDAFLIEPRRRLAARAWPERPLAHAPRTMTPDSTVFASPMIVSRDRRFLLRLHGLRCAGCGKIHALPSRVCSGCAAQDRFEEIRLGRAGAVATFTEEHLVPTPEPPVVMLVVDLDGGGRVLVQGADFPSGEAKVGRRVRLVLRVLHFGGGFPNYAWKAVPA